MRDAKRPKPARTKVEPELATARKQLKNEVSKRRELEKRLAEALKERRRRRPTEGHRRDPRVISSSPTDLGPCSDMIANAVRVCRGHRRVRLTAMNSYMSSSPRTDGCQTLGAIPVRPAQETPSAEPS